MKKSNITAIALYAALMSTTGFAFAKATTSTDCGTSPSCISMGDATSKENTVSQVNPTTASNGNDLGNDNTVKTNITGGNTTSTGGTTTSTGGTNTATGGTYTTGALSAQGGSIGNTDNASSATTGASTSSIGNTSTGGNSLTGGTQTAQTGASTSSTGAVTVNPNNTNGQSLADNSTRNTASQATGGSVGNTSTASKATGGSVGNTSTGASTSSTGAVTLTPINTQGMTDASTRNTQQQQSLTGGATTVTPTSNQNASANNSAKTGSNTSSTHVDAADRSTTNYRSVALVLPSVGVTAPSTVAVGNIIKETMACGVLQSVQRDTVKGTYMGLFKRSQIDLGTDDSLVPFTNETGEEVYYKRVLGSDGKYRLMGHQPIIYTTMLSVSGARNLSLGGGGSQQEWGQAGVGASSAMNRLVSKIQLLSCVMAVEQVPTVARIKQ